METSDYITVKNKSTVVVNVEDWRGAVALKVTIKDVIKYYAEEARNLGSGCRTLAGHTGDWRPIDNLANECLELFKQTNRNALVREAKKYGMTPKF